LLINLSNLYIKCLTLGEISKDHNWLQSHSTFPSSRLIITLTQIRYTLLTGYNFFVSNRQIILLRLISGILKKSKLLSLDILQLNQLIVGYGGSRWWPVTFFVDKGGRLSWKTNIRYSVGGEVNWNIRKMFKKLSS
jgi:hypothetical protein